MKYLVIADTYSGGYGCEYFLFGIFDTEEEAIQWIINHPVYGEDDFRFDFFEHYDEENGEWFYSRDYPGKELKKTYKPMTKEQFALRYDGTMPLYIGGYVE